MNRKEITSAYALEEKKQVWLVPFRELCPSSLCHSWGFQKTVLQGASSSDRLPTCHCHTSLVLAEITVNCWTMLRELRWYRSDASAASRRFPSHVKQKNRKGVQ